jgi:TonB family protein
MMLDPAVAHGAAFTPRPRPVRTAVSLSLALHILVLLVVAMGLARQSEPSGATVRLLTTSRVSWAGQPGSGRSEPGSPDTRLSHRVEPGRVNGPPRADRVPPPQLDREPILSLVVPPLPNPAGLLNLPGIVSALTTTDSGSTQNQSDRGTGDGSGGRGTQGSGGESGIGGSDSGSGPGSVTMPALLKQVQPAYTAEALGARAQGTVTVEAIVLPDGSVGAVRVVRSFVSNFGLDAEAIRAVKQWRFRPGTRRGLPAPMFVTIELTFTLR